MISELIYSILENVIITYTTEEVKNFWDKLKRKDFLKKTRKSIADFCNRNESTYINSDSFQTFLKVGKPLEKIITALISPSRYEDKDVIIDKLISEAETIAARNNKTMLLQDKSMIRDLCNLIYDEVFSYFMNELSSEQRVFIGYLEKRINSALIAIDNLSRELDESKMEVCSTINRLSYMNPFIAEKLSDALLHRIWSGEFLEVEDLYSMLYIL